MKKSFKSAVKEFGEIKKFSYGYNFRTAFVEDGNGQLWYFHIEDLRDKHPRVMRRKVKDLNDYTGGSNMYDVEDKLADIGIEISEKRSQRYDYNGC